MSTEENAIGTLLQTLGEDVSAQYQLLLSDDSQMLRRSFIRSFFAYVEGLTHVVKQYAMREAKRHPGDFTIAELAMLQEENYSLNNKGAVSTQRKFLPTGENFLFAMNTHLKRISGVELGIDLGGVEWQSFLKALQVRHRIVHPKSVSELTISDSEKEAIMKVSLWFNRTVIDRLLEAAESLQKTRDSLQNRSTL